MTTPRVIYISGKISGTTDYMDRFALAEKQLQSEGYTVVNPAAVMSSLPQSMPYELFMDLSYAMINYCDVIYMLPDWLESRGAKLERKYAMRKGLGVIYG